MQRNSRSYLSSVQGKSIQVANPGGLGHQVSNSAELRESTETSNQDKFPQENLHVSKRIEAEFFCISFKFKRSLSDNAVLRSCYQQAGTLLHKFSTEVSSCKQVRQVYPMRYQ